VDAERKGRLPPVCIRCGNPAAREIVRRFGRRPDDTDGLASHLNGVVGLLWNVVGLARMLHKTGRAVQVRLPLCARHLPGWFRRPGVWAVAITDDAIVLGGVSDGFMTALAGHREANRMQWEREAAEFRQPTDGADFFSPSGT
jgi:hypothetical protein